MIQHTLVFSFGQDRSEEERHEFLQNITQIMLESGMTEHVASALHKPADEDAYAPVFVSSAICEVLVEDMGTLGRLSAHEPLTTFEQDQQKSRPYQVVWVNSDVLDLSTPTAR